MQKFSAVLTKDDLDGWWVAECPELPGCMSQGRTQDEALTNLTDAIAETMHVLLSQRERWETTESGPGEVRLAVAI